MLHEAMVKFGWEGGRCSISPDEVALANVCGGFAVCLHELLKSPSRYLIDGFPRSFDNLKGASEATGCPEHLTPSMHDYKYKYIYIIS